MNLNSNVVWTLGIFSDRPQSAGGGHPPSASNGPPGSFGKADPSQRSMLPAGTVEAEVMLAACRFVGAVELDADGPPRSVVLSALCQAQLDDGRRATVPDDRGWPTSCSRPPRSRRSRKRRGWALARMSGYPGSPRSKRWAAIGCQSAKSFPASTSWCRSMSSAPPPWRCARPAAAGEAFRGRRLLASGQRSEP